MHMRDWLELELAEELRPAKAPDELWDRIQIAAAQPVEMPRRPSQSWTAWPVAALLTLAIGATMLWLVSGHSEARAAVLLPVPQQEVAMSCTDPVRVHYWTAPETVAAHLPASARPAPKSSHNEAGCGYCHTAL